MSVVGETDDYSSSGPSSDTLCVDEASLEDARSIISTSSTSGATVCWIPRGLSGRLLKALGPSTVDLVTRFTIKRRLSSISSDIDIRLRKKEALSEDETEHFGAAYRDLMELSSDSYKAKITSQAILLRLTLLRALISSERSCFSTYWHKHTLRTTWAELDNLASGSYDSNVRNLASEMKRKLVAKVTDELSGLGTLIHANELGSFLSGTHIVSILCHDLAYGTGGYAVQSALDRVSRSAWGTAQLKTLDLHGNLVLDAARRLLIDFGNVYSQGMAFRIFGGIAAEHKTRKLGLLLSGPDGVESLVARFNFLIQPEVHEYHSRFGVQCMRSMEALCTALLSACRYGFMQEVVEQGLCPSLVTLLEIFVERDRRMQRYFDDNESEDPDVERDQIAVFKLLLRFLQDEETRSILLECGAKKPLLQFSLSSNRQDSAWVLNILVSATCGGLDRC